MKREMICAYRMSLAACSLAVLVSLPASAAVRPGGWRGQPLAPLPASDKDWSVQLRTKGGELLLSVRAADTPLAAIARELERQLKIPVTLGRLLHSQRLTLSFTDLPFDQALRRLAPRPFVDYAVGGGDQGPPQRAGVYLQALNEAEPPLPAGFKSNAESFVVEGHTEGEAPPRDREPLWVSYVNGRLSLRAKKQPLTVVLARIAEQVGVPFEMRRDGDDLIDLELHSLSLEDAVRGLPPGARLYVRGDLRAAAARPLRITSEKAK